MDKKQKKEFQELYEKAHKSLQRYCAAKCYGIMEAEDLAGETILTALENFYKLKSNKAFLGFLFGIANNIIRNKLRQKKFTGTYVESDIINKTSHEICSDTKLDIKILYHALSQLPSIQSEALILFEISGFSIIDITEIQNCKASAVKQRLKRGREKLAFLLNDKEIKSESLNKKSNVLMFMFF